MACNVHPSRATCNLNLQLATCRKVFLHFCWRARPSTNRCPANKRKVGNRSINRRQLFRHWSWHFLLLIATENFDFLPIPISYQYRFHNDFIPIPISYRNRFHTDFIPIPISYRFHTDTDFIPIPISYRYRYRFNTDSDTDLIPIPIPIPIWYRFQYRYRYRGIWTPKYRYRYRIQNPIPFHHYLLYRKKGINLNLNVK